MPSNENRAAMVSGASPLLKRARLHGRELRLQIGNLLVNAVRPALRIWVQTPLDTFDFALHDG